MQCNARKYQRVFEHSIDNVVRETGRIQSEFEDSNAAVTRSRRNASLPSLADFPGGRGSSMQGDPDPPCDYRQIDWLHVRSHHAGPSCSLPSITFTLSGRVPNLSLRSETSGGSVSERPHLIALNGRLQTALPSALS